MGMKSIPKISFRQLSWSSSSSRSSDDSNDPFLPSKEISSSPPSSPGLPKYTIPEEKKSRLSIFVHAAIWSLLVGFLLWAITALFYRSQGFKTDLNWISVEGENHTLVHVDAQPADLIPVVFNDSEGKTRWTISIPDEREFPLAPADYMNLCIKAHEVPHHLMMDKQMTGHFGYYHRDDMYMNVNEAEQKAFLPPSLKPHHDSVVAGVEDHANDGEDNVDIDTGMCKRSITYVMQSFDAGFGGSLMGLWLAYGLAVKENRAFFIDDRNW
jgi:hypothetical protein